MKKISFFIAVLLLQSSALLSQSVGINTDGSAPNSSAMLDVSSTTRGFLPPRMSYAQREMIMGPVAGLIVWCTNCGPNGELQVYNGTTWTNMIGGSASPSMLVVGESYGGGVIFYVDGTGLHGLIAATSDQGTTDWGCFGISIDGTSPSIGTGQANTTAIVNGCVTAGIAARICNDLVLNGYDDWFLPSNNELMNLSTQKVAVGGFASAWYWSSSQFSANQAYAIDFSTSNAVPTNKNSGGLYVRAVRAF